MRRKATQARAAAAAVAAHLQALADRSSASGRVSQLLKGVAPLACCPQLLEAPVEAGLVRRGQEVQQGRHRLVQGHDGM